MNTKSLRISALLSAALFLTLSVSQADVETTQALNGATVTKIRVNGLSADMFSSTTRPAQTDFSTHRGTRSRTRRRSTSRMSRQSRTRTSWS
jgi:hypothetical protein